MTKALESWKEVKDYLNYCLYGITEDCKAIRYTSTSGYLQPFIDDVEKELKKLEELDSGKYAIIQIPRQADNSLLKAYQIQSEILRIIKEKKVDTWGIWMFDNVNEYNHQVYQAKGCYDMLEKTAKPLTQEEFNLLKEWLQ